MSSIPEKSYSDGERPVWVFQQSFPNVGTALTFGIAPNFRYYETMAAFLVDNPSSGRINAAPENGGYDSNHYRLDD